MKEIKFLRVPAYLSIIGPITQYRVVSGNKTQGIVIHIELREEDVEPIFLTILDSHSKLKKLEVINAFNKILKTKKNPSKKKTNYLLWATVFVAFATALSAAAKPAPAVTK